MTSTTSTSSNFPDPRRVVRRITRTLPDGTTEVIEEYESAPAYTPTTPVFPQYPTTPPLSPGPQRWLQDQNHSCPLTDPRNAGKPMLYYCPVCNGVQC